MKILGTILIILGAFGTLMALLMSFFCNVKAGNPEDKEDVIIANNAIKFYRTVLLVSLAILAIGIILHVI